MSDLASPLQVATVVNALLWPLAAGAAVVVWSKIRSAAHARRVAALENQLRGAYRTVESEPLPAQLSMVVDALEEGRELTADPAAKPKTSSPAGS